MSVIDAKSVRAAVIDPMPHLLGAQLGRLGIQPGLDQHGADRVARQADQVDPAIGARAASARGTGTGSTRPGIGMDTFIIRKLGWSGCIFQASRGPHSSADERKPIISKPIP
jgi:hypothetical protein